MNYENTINFTYESELIDEEYPPRLVVNVECSGDSTLKQVVQAFRMFLKACEYNEELIEKIDYEDRD